MCRSNYFRITAYNPNSDYCLIIDSNGYFEKLWQFSSFLIQKGLKVLEVASSDKFDEGNIPFSNDTSALILRACNNGKPLYNGKNITVRTKSYKIHDYTNHFISKCFP